MIELEIIDDKWQNFDTDINGKTWLLEFIYSPIDMHWYTSFKKYDNNGVLQEIQGFTRVLKNNEILRSWSKIKGNFVALAMNRVAESPIKTNSFLTDFAYIYYDLNEIIEEDEIIEEEFIDKVTYIPPIDVLIYDSQDYGGYDKYGYL